MNSLPLFIFTGFESGETLLYRARLGCRQRSARAGARAVHRRTRAGQVTDRPLVKGGMSCQGVAWPWCWPAMMTLPSALSLLSATPASAFQCGTPLALITGSGSSWAANAVDKWIANVQSQGIQVVFTADGSAAGRRTSRCIPSTSPSATSATRARPGHRDERRLQPSVCLPAGHGGRDILPLQHRGRREADHEPAAVRANPRQDLHQPDHELGRPGHYHGQQRPRAARPADHRRWCTPRDRGRPRSVHAIPELRYSRAAGSPSTTGRPGRPSTGPGREATRSPRTGSAQVMNYIASDGCERLYRHRRIFLRAGRPDFRSSSWRTRPAITCCRVSTTTPWRSPRRRST